MKRLELLRISDKSNKKELCIRLEIGDDKLEIVFDGKETFSENKNEFDHAWKGFLTGGLDRDAFKKAVKYSLGVED